MQRRARLLQKVFGEDGPSGRIPQSGRKRWHRQRRHSRLDKGMFKRLI